MLKGTTAERDRSRTWDCRYYDTTCGSLHGPVTCGDDENWINESMDANCDFTFDTGIVTSFELTSAKCDGGECSRSYQPTYMRVSYRDEQNIDRTLLSTELDFDGSSKEVKTFDVMKVITSNLNFYFFNRDHTEQIKLYKVKISRLRHGIYY